MEKHGPNIIHMSIQRDYTPFELIVPDLDLKIISARNKQRLGQMEIDASDRALVFVEGLQQSAQAVVQQLDLPGVQGGQCPGTFRVERDTFYTLAFRVEFSQH